MKVNDHLPRVKKTLNDSLPPIFILVTVMDPAIGPIPELLITKSKVVKDKKILEEYEELSVRALGEIGTFTEGNIDDVFTIRTDPTETVVHFGVFVPGGTLNNLDKKHIILTAVMKRKDLEEVQPIISYLREGLREAAIALRLGSELGKAGSGLQTFLKDLSALEEQKEILQKPSHKIEPTKEIIMAEKHVEKPVQRLEDEIIPIPLTPIDKAKYATLLPKPLQEFAIKILAQIDGKTSIQTIANRLNLPFSGVYAFTLKLQKAGLIKHKLFLADTDTAQKILSKPLREPVTPIKRKGLEKLLWALKLKLKTRSRWVKAQDKISANFYGGLYKAYLKALIEGGEISQKPTISQAILFSASKKWGQEAFAGALEHFGVENIPKSFEEIGPFINSIWASITGHHLKHETTLKDRKHILTIIDEKCPICEEIKVIPSFIPWGICIPIAGFLQGIIEDLIKIWKNLGYLQQYDYQEITVTETKCKAKEDKYCLFECILKLKT